jgi:hypothetical protein
MFVREGAASNRLNGRVRTPLYLFYEELMKRPLLSSAVLFGAFALSTEAAALDDIDLDLSGYFAGGAGVRVESDASRIRNYTFGLDSEGHLEGSYIFQNGLQIGAPTIFRSTNADNWEIDPAEFNTVNTRNTVNDGLGDFSPRVIYLTPRIFGLQGGVSFVPEADDCDHDFCPRTDSVFPPLKEEVVELGANFYHTFSNGTLEGVSVGVSGTYLMADSKSTAAITTVLGIDDYGAWNVGASVALDGFTIGGSFKNAELAALGLNYLAYDVGATYERGPWGFMVSYGADDNQLTGQETMAIQGGVDFMLGAGVSVGIGAQYVDANFQMSTLLSAAGPSSFFSDIDSTAVFIETDISF